MGTSSLSRSSNWRYDPTSWRLEPCAGRELQLQAAAVHHRLVLVDVAAGGVDPVEGEVARRALRGEVQRDRAALRPQVPVPDHLGQGYRHEEAAALRHQRPELHAPVGEIEPRVARAVVVAHEEERCPRRRDVVLLVAVVERPAHPQLHGAHRQLEPRAGLEEVAVLVDGVGPGDVPRPLVAGQGVPREPEGLRRLLLVDRRRILGGGEDRECEDGGRRDGEGGASHARRSPLTGGDRHVDPF